MNEEEEEEKIGLNQQEKNYNLHGFVNYGLCSTIISIKENCKKLSNSCGCKAREEKLTKLDFPTITIARYKKNHAGANKIK